MILLVGKTCAGKDTIQKELINMGMHSVVSYTTRPPRPGEMDGITYHFITREEFLKKESEGFFAETASYNVASGETWHYGSASEDLTDDKVIIVNPHGLKQIKKINSLNPVAFYVISDEETIWNRLRQRGDDASEARRRLNEDDNDFADIDDLIDFSIRNGTGSSSKAIAEMIMYLYGKLNEERDSNNITEKGDN